MEEFQLEINAQHFSTLLKQTMRKQILVSRGVYAQKLWHVTDGAVVNFLESI